MPDLRCAGRAYLCLIAKQNLTKLNITINPKQFCKREPIVQLAEFEKQWPLLKTAVRQQWRQLTHRDIEQISGGYVRLIALVQERYGLRHEEAEREVRSWVLRQK